MLKFTIGITTYGPIPRAESLIRSLKQHMDKEYGGTPTIILCDNGTQPNLLGPRKLFCEREGITLILHGQNRGIPASWNTIRKHVSADIEVLLILSDGVRFLMPGWLTALSYFLEQNHEVGGIGLPLLHRNIDNGRFDPHESRWDAPAGRVGCAVGCCFAFRPQLADLIVNPDGTTGFWEGLFSFHEEVTFGFRLAEIGYTSYMIPWPPVSYLGGMAFAAHSELTWCDLSPYLTMAEFLEYARSSAWYIPAYEENYAQGKVDCMMMSRAMFCKYWGNMDAAKKGGRMRVIKGQEVDILDMPQIFVHECIVTPIPSSRIKWLNQHGQECEDMLS